MGDYGMAAKLAGGNKRSGYELGQNADINVTPFVDVMLVLLIIFMVAAPLATTALAIDLPPAQAPKNPQDQKKPTFISIARGGVISIIPDGSLGPPRIGVDLPNLTSVLVPLLGGDPGPPRDKTILIRADKDVRYKEFMAVVNQLESEGFYKVGLISEELG
jgi:biopolymer transport protein ExbD